MIKIMAMLGIAFFVVVMFLDDILLAGVFAALGLPWYLVVGLSLLILTIIAWWKGILPIPI